MWGATFSMAIRAVRRNLLRSALTSLGIVIGVASVIAMVTLGQAVSARVAQDVRSLGSNMLIVSPGAERRGPVSSVAPNFKSEDVRAIRQEVPSLVALAPTVAQGVLAVNGSLNYSTTAQGSTNDYFAVRGFKIARGRGFSDAELGGGSLVCVLGDTPRRKLFGSSDPLGVKIRLGKVVCEVIGVLESKGQAALGMDQDDLIVLPLSTVQRRLAATDDISSIYVSVENERALAVTKGAIERLLRERRRIAAGQADDFNVQDTREIAKTLGSVTGVLTILLGAIAAVSLLVGGIGIMNIMLVSVTERTREIGIRLAIGALASEVMLQFLVEAVVLCMVGGVLGVLLGVGSSWIVSRVFSLPFAVDALVVTAAVVFSAAIGVAFGYFPARRAARLDPIEALRHE